MYVIIDERFLDSDRQAARQRASEQYPNEERPTLLWTPNDIEEKTSFDIDLENNVLVVTSKNCLGDFIIRIPFTIEMETKILEHAARQVNKMKAALQSMK